MGKYIHKFDTISDLYDYLEDSPVPNSDPWVSQTAGNIMTYSQKFDFDALTNQAPSIAYVDFGLPSGTLWATFNLGAYSPEETGDYYAWGEVETKNSYTWENYIYGSGDNGFDDYNDSGMTLNLIDDVANGTYGGAWHIPTPEECLELFNYSSIEYNVSVNGVSCVRLTSTADSTKSLIFPCTGVKSDSTLYDTDCAIIWTNQTSNEDSYSANTLGFSNTYESASVGEYAYTSRRNGCCIRPVISNARRPWHNIPKSSPSGGEVIK